MAVSKRTHSTGLASPSRGACGQGDESSSRRSLLRPDCSGPCICGRIGRHRWDHSQLHECLKGGSLLESADNLLERGGEFVVGGIARGPEGVAALPISLGIGLNDEKIELTTSGTVSW